MYYSRKKYWGKYTSFPTWQIIQIPAQKIIPGRNETWLNEVRLFWVLMFWCYLFLQVWFIQSRSLLWYLYLRYVYLLFCCCMFLQVWFVDICSLSIFTCSSGAACSCRSDLNRVDSAVMISIFKVCLPALLVLYVPAGLI